MTYALMVILFCFGICLGRLSVIEKREKETHLEYIKIPLDDIKEFTEAVHANPENDLKQFDNINREKPKYGEYK